MVEIEENKKKILEEIEKSEYIRSMKLEFMELDENHTVARIPFTKGIQNSYGSVHGGYLYSIADTVAGVLACMCGDFCTTVDGSMNYFEPALDTEYVYCYAFLVRRGKHLINVKVEIKDDKGKLLDDASLNYFRLKQ